MSAPLVLLAAGLAGQIDTWIFTKSSWGGFLLIVASLLLTTCAVFIWAAFFRKPPHPRHHHHWRSPKSSGPAHSAEPRRHRSRLRFWRRRRHRHKKRPPNPTLAETGGLPPSRESGTGSHSI